MASHPLLAAYVPSDSDPFDAVKAAHLLNRAGFGGTEDEIDHIINLGPKKAVEFLMDFPDAPAEEQRMGDTPSLAGLDGYPSDFRKVGQMLAGKTEEEKKQIQQQLNAANHDAVMATQGWWLNRMATAQHPLQEKLTFFWHGHFTTSAKDERSALLIWRQNELLRRFSAGNFEQFVHAVSRDPAMLDYLNNTQNRKAHPNENYARELMELFTLGIGNYTENDIKNSARAFTGWDHDGDQYVFRAGQHDTGAKTFFGRTGNFNGDDIIAMILQKPACPKFIAGELFKLFAYDDMEKGLNDALGEMLYNSKYELRPLIRQILSSRAFYSPNSIGVQIKSPVQLVIGTVRTLGLTMPTTQALTSMLTQMGQVPLLPPNVRGWPGGHMWINTSTLFIRYNTCVFLAGGDAPAVDRIGPKGQTRGAIPPRQVGSSNFNPNTGVASAEEIVDDWINRLIHRPVEEDKKDVLVEALGTKPSAPESIRKLVQLIVSMPEYQLC